MKRVIARSTNSARSLSHTPQRTTPKRKGPDNGNVSCRRPRYRTPESRPQVNGSTVCSSTLRGARQEVPNLIRTQDVMRNVSGRPPRGHREVSGRWSCSNSLQDFHSGGSQGALPRLRSAVVQTFVCMACVDTCKSLGLHGRAVVLCLYSITLLYWSFLTPVPHCIEYCNSVRNLQVR